MEEPATVYVTGTAGAGKTSFVRAFRTWMQSAGYDCLVVNLDPGTESDDLEPDVDVREWVRLGDVMDEYGLGPNGAQVAAADLVALKIFEIRTAIQESKVDYTLIDTPGQVELFAFRESSRSIVEALSGDRSLLAFLFDPALARTAAGFVSLLMLSSTVEFRFRLPTLNVLSKADLLTPEQLEEVAGWGEDPDRLYEAVTRETSTPDVQLSTELFRALQTMGPLASVIPVSSQGGTGLEAFYRSCQQVFGAGEDLEASQGPTDS